MESAEVRLRLGPFVVEIGRWVYGTVILMTVLVVYADDGPVSFGEAAGVVAAPLIATFLAHLFSVIMAAESGKHGGLNRRELAYLVRSEAQFLMLALPPFVVLLVGALGAFTPRVAVSLILWGGVALLVFVGGFAGRRVGLGWWGVAASAAGSGTIGLVVLVAQLLLK
ncbi:MAG: hypothetical protein ACRDRV_07440 [Pseudonocardiaceae bacterium]